MVAGIKSLFSENDTHCQLALNARMAFGDIRVPMDIRRENVTGPPWMTWDIGPENISTTAGILDVLGHAKGIGCRSSRSHPIPLLCDVNIYGRLMKLQYFVSYAAFNCRKLLQPFPLLFGVWHGYKHCIEQTYSRFLPLLAAVEAPNFLTNPTGTSLLRSPKLAMMETVLAAIYLCAHNVLPPLKNLLTHRNEFKIMVSKGAHPWLVCNGCSGC